MLGAGGVLWLGDNAVPLWGWGDKGGGGGRHQDHPSRDMAQVALGTPPGTTQECPQGTLIRA